MAATDYNGTITISGSSVRAGQQADFGASECHHAAHRAAQQQFAFVQPSRKERQAQTDPVAVTDAGQGTLTVSGVTATAANSGTWLTATTVTGGITVTADPTGLSPDTYTGTVTIASNGDQRQRGHPGGAHGCGARSASRIRRRRGQQRNLREWRAAGPRRHRRGVRQSIHFDAPQSATSLPLQTTLDGVQVLVNGKAAPLYYVSSGQINFEIPIDAATGRRNDPGGAQRPTRAI